MVIVRILLVVALWWHCDDTVVTVVVTLFIVVALWPFTKSKNKFSKSAVNCRF